MIILFHFFFFVIFHFFLFKIFQPVLTGIAFESKQEKTDGSSLEGKINHVLPSSILIFVRFPNNVWLWFLPIILLLMASPSFFRKQKNPIWDGTFCLLNSSQMFEKKTLTYFPGQCNHLAHRYLIQLGQNINLLFIDIYTIQVKFCLTVQGLLTTYSASSILAVISLI